MLSRKQQWSRCTRGYSNKKCSDCNVSNCNGCSIPYIIHGRVSYIRLKKDKSSTIQKKDRHVHFNEKVHVVIIPPKEEYHMDKYKLWYNRDDYQYFQQLYNYETRINTLINVDTLYGNMLFQGYL